LSKKLKDKEKIAQDDFEGKEMTPINKEFFLNQIYFGEKNQIMVFFYM
jgi:hypothetical protein